ncbi:MAG TPA: PAS domain-containing protein, partial [Leptospiraceae bacterium]|nr:PAS domain-containing protein [Leptospiraceae bacterium]
MLIRNISIQAKLVLLYFLAFFCSGLLISFFGIGISDFESKINTFINNQNKTNIEFKDLQIEVNESTFLLSEMILSQSPEKAKSIAQNLELKNDLVITKLETLQKQVQDPSIKEELLNLKNNFDLYHKAANEVKSLAMESKFIEAESLYQKNINSLLIKVKTNEKELNQLFEKSFKENSENTMTGFLHQKSDLTTKSVLFVSVILLLMGFILFGVVFTIKSAHNSFKRIHSGDFKEQLNEIGKDEIAQISKTFNTFYSSYSAINRSQAVIEFSIDGTVLSANDNFLTAMGYTLNEIKGQHHRMFVDSAFSLSEGYSQFWASLARGEFQSGEFKRIGKGGKEVWLQASYNPIFDSKGRPFKVVKFASVVTEQKRKNLEYEGQIAAIAKSQAVIEFTMDGLIVSANDNFLNSMGYTLSEIKGQHHRMFVDKNFSLSEDYRQFWLALGKGEYQSGEFKRIGKGGKEVWLQASYTPILDLSGKPIKVIKFASLITEQKQKNLEYEGQIAAIGKSQAVIEFTMDGLIVSANDNFLNSMGYTLSEIKGQHHRMFVDSAYANSEEYRQFWNSLTRGEYQNGEFKRIGKNGKEVWLQATYNPILDLSGRPFKVVKFALEVTKQKLKNVEYEGQIRAIDKSQALIEFRMDGTILTANDNFLAAMGYNLNEIKDQHHKLFVDSSYAASEDYREFWASLNRGEFRAAEYKRLAKGGREVWLQATYSPILDLNGKPYKVIKFATVITEQKILANETARIVSDLIPSLAALEKGDLTNLIQSEYEGSFAKLKDSFNNTLNTLQGIIEEVSSSTDAVVSAAEEVSSTAQSLSQSASEQAANVEETSASLEQMSANINQNADNAKQTNTIATKAATDAVQGGASVLETVKAMKQIAQKIGIVEDIAYQTNLLALNAAIEAARAGEHGKGFAVVASEVRKLAERSQFAANEISDLASSSVQIAENAGKLISDIVPSIHKTADLVQEIAASSAEQASGVGQINKAITQLDSVT